MLLRQYFCKLIDCTPVFTAMTQSRNSALTRSVPQCDCNIQLIFEFGATGTQTGQGFWPGRVNAWS